MPNNKKGFSGLSDLSSDLSQYDSFISTSSTEKDGESITEGNKTIRLETNRDDFKQLSSIAQRALDLERLAELARSKNDIEAAKSIFGELVDDLVPRTKHFIDGSDNKAFAYFAHGLVLRIAGMKEDAVEMYVQSLHYSPEIINTILEVTRCLGELGRVREALHYAKRAVEVEQDSAPAWGNLAMTNIQIGNRDEALSAIKKAIELDPKDPKNIYIYKNFERYFS